MATHNTYTSKANRNPLANYCGIYNPSMVAKPKVIGYTRKGNTMAPVYYNGYGYSLSPNATKWHTSPQALMA